MNNADMPAIPVVNSEGFSAHPASGAIDPGTCSGLTKREYFAGLAMNRILAKDERGVMSPEITAQASVRMADALLAELERTK